MNQFSLIELAKLVLHRIWIVILCVIVMLVLGLVYCNTIADPKYAASADILVASGELFKENNPDATSTPSQGTYISTAELSTSLALMKSFASVITKSDECYDLALKEAEKLQRSSEAPLSGTYTVESLKGATKVDYDDESIILTITVTTGNKNDSQILVSALANVSPDFICSCIGRTSSVKLNVDETARKVSPNTMVICFAMVIVGIVGAVAFIWIAESLNKTIKSEEDFTSHYDIPLLGSIPEFSKNGKKRKKA